MKQAKKDNSVYMNGTKLSGIRNSDLYPNSNRVSSNPNEDFINNELNKINQGSAQFSINRKGYNIGLGTLLKSDYDKVTRDKSLGNYGESQYDNPLMVNPTSESVQNERAEEQGALSTIANGVMRGIGTFGTALADTAGALTYGVAGATKDLISGKGIMESFGNFGKNPIADTGTDFYNYMEKEFPAYKSVEEEQGNWAANIFTHPANFIADMMDNMGFMLEGALTGKLEVGAVSKGLEWVSDIAGKISKGNSILSKIPSIKKIRTAFNSINTVAADNGVPVSKLLKGIESAEKGDMSILNAISNGKLNFSGDFMKDLVSSANMAKKYRTGMGLVGALGGAIGEGAFQAATDSRDKLNLDVAKIDGSIEKLRPQVYQRLQKERPDLFTQDQNGNVIPTEQGRQYAENFLEAHREDMIKQAKDNNTKMAGMDFIMNIPILTLSDFITFGKYYTSGFNSSRRILNSVGNDTKASAIKNFLTGGENSLGRSEFSELGNRVKGSLGNYTLKKPGLLEKTWGMLKSPIAEGNEELMQQAATFASGYNYDDTPDDMFHAKHNSKYNNLLSASLRGFADTYGDYNQWQQFAAAFISTAFGIPVYNKNAKFKVELAGNIFGSLSEINKRTKEEQELVDRANQAATDLTKSRISHIVANQYFEDGKAMAALNNDRKKYMDYDMSSIINDVVSLARIGKTQDLIDYIKPYTELTGDNKDVIQQIYDETKESPKAKSTDSSPAQQAKTKIEETEEESAQQPAEESKEPVETDTENYFFPKDFDIDNDDQRNQIAQEISKRASKVLDTIKNASLASQALVQRAGDVFSPEDLDYLTWNIVKMQDAEKRSHELYDNIQKAIRENIDNPEAITYINKNGEKKSLKDLASLNYMEFINELVDNGIVVDNRNKEKKEDEKKESQLYEDIINSVKTKKIAEFEEIGNRAAYTNSNKEEEFNTNNEAIKDNETIIQNLKELLETLDKDSKEYEEKNKQLAERMSTVKALKEQNENITNELENNGRLIEEQLNKLVKDSEQFIVDLNDLVLLHHDKINFAKMYNEYIRHPEMLKALREKIDIENKNRIIEIEKAGLKKQLEEAGTEAEFKNIIKNYSGHLSSEDINDVVKKMKNEGNKIAKDLIKSSFIKDLDNKKKELVKEKDKEKEESDNENKDEDKGLSLDDYEFDEHGRDLLGMINSGQGFDKKVPDVDTGSERVSLTKEQIDENERTENDDEIGVKRYIIDEDNNKVIENPEYLDIIKKNEANEKPEVKTEEGEFDRMNFIMGKPMVYSKDATGIASPFKLHYLGNGKYSFTLNNDSFDAVNKETVAEQTIEIVNKGVKVDTGNGKIITVNSSKDLYQNSQMVPFILKGGSIKFKVVKDGTIEINGKTPEIKSKIQIEIESNVKEAPPKGSGEIQFPTDMKIGNLTKEEDGIYFSNVKSDSAAGHYFEIKSVSPNSKSAKLGLKNDGEANEMAQYSSDCMKVEGNTRLDLDKRTATVTEGTLVWDSKKGKWKVADKIIISIEEIPSAPVTDESNEDIGVVYQGNEGGNNDLPPIDDNQGDRNNKTITEQAAKAANKNTDLPLSDKDETQNVWHPIISEYTTQSMREGKFTIYKNTENLVKFLQSVGAFTLYNKLKVNSKIRYGYSTQYKSEYNDLNSNDDSKKTVFLFNDKDEIVGVFPPSGYSGSVKSLRRAMNNADSSDFKIKEFTDKDGNKYEIRLFSPKGEYVESTVTKMMLGRIPITGFNITLAQAMEKAKQETGKDPEVEFAIVKDESVKYSKGGITVRNSGVFGSENSGRVFLLIRNSDGMYEAVAMKKIREVSNVGDNSEYSKKVRNIVEKFTDNLLSNIIKEGTDISEFFPKDNNYEGLGLDSFKVLREFKNEIRKYVWLGEPSDIVIRINFPLVNNNGSHERGVLLSITNKNDVGEGDTDPTHNEIKVWLGRVDKVKDGKISLVNSKESIYKALLENLNSKFVNVSIDEIQEKEYKDIYIDSDIFEVDIDQARIVSQWFEMSKLEGKDFSDTYNTQTTAQEGITNPVNNESSTSVNTNKKRRGKLRSYDNIGGENKSLKPRLATLNTGTYNIGNVTNELAWIKKVLPKLALNDRIKFVKGLINVGNKVAWGTFSNNMITLSNIAAEGTLYHEAFHYVFNSLATELEKSKLLSEARSTYGNLSSSELEEKLAEEFREYVMTKQEPKNIGERILEFFKQLFIKVTNWENAGSYAENFYRAINNGDFSNREELDNNANSDEVNQDEINSENNNESPIKIGTFAEQSNKFKDMYQRIGGTEEFFNSLSEELKERAVSCIF